jgi:hypothetical protein
MQGLTRRAQSFGLARWEGLLLHSTPLAVDYVCKTPTCVKHGTLQDTGKNLSWVHNDADIVNYWSTQVNYIAYRYSMALLSC